MVGERHVLGLGVLAWSIAACGGGAPAATERPGSGITATPGSDGEGQPGLAVADDEELRAALVRIHELGENPIPTGTDLARLIPQGVPILNPDCMPGDCGPFNDPSCHSRPTASMSPGTVVCDAERRRCVVGGQHVYLFRPGRDGIWLFAILISAEPAVADAPQIAHLLDRRDELCALYDAVRSGTIAADPGGYVRASAAPEESEEQSAHRWEDRCGQAAGPALRADLARFRDGLLACTGTECIDFWDRDDAQSFLHARQAAGGAPTAIGFVDAPDGAHILHEDVLSRHAGACGAAPPVEDLGL